MRRRSRLDWILLATLVPFWALCQLLHLDRQLDERPLARFPVYVAPAASATGYPTVLGLWPEVADRSTLRPGDRLRALGGVDLGGAGRLDVLVQAYETAVEGVVLASVERAGTPLETSLTLLPVPAAWAQGVLSGALGISGVLVLLGGRGSRTARAYAVAALVYSLHFCSLYGGSPAQTRFGVALLVATAALYPPLALRAALLFPEGGRVRSRIARALPWTLVVTGPAVYVWLLGAPSLGLFGFTYASVCYAAVTTSLLAVLARNYGKADARGRRQMRWGVLGFFLGMVPPAAASAAAALAPELRPVYEASLVFEVVIPLFLFVALVRDNLFDIDRLVTLTGAWTLSLLGGIGVLVLLGPPATAWASERTGLEPMTALVVLAIALAAPAPAAARRCRPLLERWLFAERSRREAALRALRSEIGQHDSAAELLRGLCERLVEIVGLESCALFARADGRGFVPIFARGSLVPPGFSAEGRLAALLSDADAPIVAERWRRWVRQGALGGDEAGALESLGAEVLLPLRCGDVLDAVVALGVKASGDLFTPSEVALLDGVAERASARLALFDASTLDRSELELYQQLARYAPGAVAEELRRGEPITPAEREITILFVDIRGYTSFAAQRDAPAIFRVVNAYTRAVSQIVREHGGAVVEFHGDGLMATFGAPVALAGKERLAVEAAREIVKRLEEGDLAEGAPLSCGVGIATGTAYVGDIQAADRRIWAAIGNTTNLAARLEGLTRTLPAAIVIDELTHQRCGETVADFRPRDDVRLKGRDGLFRVWLHAVREEAIEATPRAA
jgi:class 3 adenylate cyclase